MTRAAYLKKILKLAATVGLPVIKSEMKECDLGLPIAHLFVPESGANFRLSQALNQKLSKDVRFGWYSAKIGYEDVPAGQAMIELDCLPLSVQ
jgi:hypothetical protein